MGGILGHEAWRRSNGGLWVPRLFGEVQFGWWCCEEEDPFCTHCQHLAEQYDVTISGYADSVTDEPPACGEVTATNCDTMNGTFRLTFVSQATGSGNEPIGCPGGRIGNGGCVYSSGRITGVKLNYLYSSCIGHTDGFVITMHVWPSGTGKIKVTLSVQIDDYQNHFYFLDNITCTSGMLSSVNIPACSSSPGQACFDGGVTGNALLEAV